MASVRHYGMTYPIDILLLGLGKVPSAACYLEACIVSSNDLIYQAILLGFKW